MRAMLETIRMSGVHEMAGAIGWPNDANYEAIQTAPIADAGTPDILMVPSLAAKLSDARVALYLEPGRALLDGAGMTVFPVQGFKRNAGHGIATVAGLSMSLSDQWKNSEFLPAPILVQRGPDRIQEPVQTAVGGSSCMEYDVLTWRKVGFPAAPRYGDFIVYPNTAGYQMDKNESEFHQLALPPKIVVTQAARGLAWRLDER